MKFVILFTLLFSTQLSLAETIREENIKKEMLKRVDVLTEKIQTAKTLLGKKKAVEACAVNEEIFKLYPEHVKDIGGYMNLFKSKVSKLKDSALSELIKFHGLSNTCHEGKDAEYVDIKKMQKSLSRALLSLEKHKEIIEFNKTNQDNTFYYEYDL